MSRTPEEFVQSRHGACRPKEGSPYWCATHGSMKQIEVCNDVLDLADDIESYVLERDDARDPQADPDTVTLPREDAERLLDCWAGDDPHAPEGPMYRRVRAALGWGDSDDA